MNSQIAQTSKGAIEYTLLGNGPVVLVCHGTSSNCFSTELADPLLKAGFSILRPSRPGYGRTPLEVGQDAIQSAEAMIELLDCLQIQTCFLIAISGGGPTGIALAASFPQRIRRLVLVEALSYPENRPNEPAYKNQTAFYGPLHPLMWGLLGIMSRLSPRNMAHQTLATFSTHDPKDALGQLSSEDIKKLCRFYQGRSSRQGALADAYHTVGSDLLASITQPTLVVHSREDNAVPFRHAEWALEHIPHSELCESGITGHFFWVGPDYERICRKMIGFFQESPDIGE